MIALGQLCVHPDSNKPYIKSVIGGRDHSYINLQVRFSIPNQGRKLIN